MGLSIEITTTGPIFDGTIGDVLSDLQDEWRDSVALAVTSELHSIMDSSFVNPTPYYEVQVINELQVPDRVVHDRGIIYGPWLEGIGSRNARSRFKGYSMWRRTVQEVEGRTVAIGEEVAARYQSRLDG